MKAGTWNLGIGTRDGKLCRTPIFSSKFRISEQKTNGFSLIEFMIALAISLLLAIAFANVRSTLFLANTSAQESLRSSQELRRVLTEMVTELRNVQTSAMGAYPIEAASRTGITFYSDVDGDRKPERLRYELQGATLVRGETMPTGTPLTYDLSTEATTTVVSYLVNSVPPMFSYYDGGYVGNGNQLPDTPDPARVRMVQVTLSVDSDPGKPPGIVTESASSMLRSLKDNL